MKNFVLSPDGSYSRFSNKTQDFLKKLRVMNIEFLMEYYSMQYEVAAWIHDDLFKQLSKEHGSAFLAVDFCLNYQMREPMMTFLLCDDPMVTLSEETITFSTHTFVLNTRPMVA